MERKQRVLIVEDEKNIVDILRFNLQKEGYDTLEAFDGVTGLRLALEESPDLILLDLMLPGMNGFEVCKLLRDKGKNTPVLIITAREEEKDKILGLDLGADDYITKPFSIRELMARVKANIRRVALSGQGAAQPAQEQVLDFGRLVIHKEQAQVTKDGERLELTQREFELLTYLASHAGRVFSRQELMERVWNYEGYVGDVRGVDVAVRRLREKIEDDPGQPKYIITRRGAGYYFQKDF
ncbi:MAG TPA: response regulator transcription factor [Candidatus Evtepia faecigallinarum]|nr:response regulator transcription factor [Candidatus Evtepia faecigallinarum]